MCGRYYIAEDGTAEGLRQIIDAVNCRNPAAKTSGDIPPGDSVPVLASKPGLPQRTCHALGRHIARRQAPIQRCSETAAEKAIFRGGMT